VVLAPRDDWTTLAILSGLGLASLALVGHATMQSGPEGIVHRVNHALHLVSTGAWLGGLIPVLCLDADAKSDLKRNAVEAMTRFSFFGHFVVRRSWRRELSTSRLLDAKIGLVAIAAWREAEALSALRQDRMIEVGLGTIVVALVNLFALLDPA
jgi:putative copper resistance protein D